MSTLTPIVISKTSPHLGLECALCHEPFEPGDDLIICPRDGVRHHRACWIANGQRCAALGCSGSGRPADVVQIPPPPAREVPPRSKVRALPQTQFNIRPGCLVLSVTAAVVLLAIGCFGLWAVVDYLMIEVYGLNYREPLPQLALLLPLLF
jgi:hypothetical protein